MWQSVTKEKFVAIEQKVENMVAKQTNEEILEWLSDIRVSNYHQTVRHQMLKRQYWESGQWFLANKKYKEWKKAPSGVFWLQGGMGAGKTCLVSIVIQQLFKDSGNQELAYFYCSSTTQSIEPTSVIRSLLVQLAYNPDGKSISEAITSKYNDRTSPDLDLSMESWIKVLIEITKHHSQTTIVIDALDEYPRSYELLEGLKSIHKTSPHMRFFFSSRPNEESVLANFPLRHDAIIELQNAADVEHYITTEMTSKARVYKSGLKDREDLQGRLREILLARGQWMYEIIFPDLPELHNAH
jgi:hypothetical protein